MLTPIRALTLLLLAAVVLAVTANAATVTTVPVIARPPITAANAGAVTQIAMLGRGWVTDIAWSPDEAMLAVGTSAGVWLYDMHAPERPPRYFDTGRGRASRVAFSADGATLAAAIETPRDDFTTAGAVWLWDAATGAQLHVWAHDPAPGAIAFSPAGTLLAAVVAQGPLVHIWALTPSDAGALTTDLQAEVDTGTSVRAMAFSADATYLVTGGGFIVGSRQPQILSPVRVWDTATGAMVGERMHYALASYLAVAPAGVVAANAENGIGLRLWDAHSAADLAAIEPGVSGPAAFSPDGNLLAYTVQTNNDAETWSPYRYQVNVYDTRTGAKYPALPSSWNTVRALAFSPGSNTLALVGETAAAEQVIAFIDTATGEARAAIPAWPGGMEGVAFSPDEALLYATSGASVRLWDVASATEHLAVPLPADGAPAALGPSADPLLLAAPTTDSAVQVWDVRTQRGTVSLAGLTQRVIDLSFSPDGRWLAASAWDGEFGRRGEVRVWEVGAWAAHAVFEGEGELTFSPEGTTLAAADRGEVRVWDVEEGTLAAVLEGDFAQEPYSVLFSPDGSLMLYGRGARRTMRDMVAGTDRYDVPGRWGEVFSPDGSLVAMMALYDPDRAGAQVTVWDAATGLERAALDAPDASYFTHIFFSPDGRTLVAVDAYRPQTWVWDIPTGAMPVNIDGQAAVTFNSDGALLATASRDGRIHLWSAETWAEAAALPGHSGEIYGIVFSADGTLLASGSGLFGDGVIRVWGAP